MDEMETWQKALNELAPATFQRLCFELVTVMGFKNVDLWGGPGDKGKDIVAELTRREPDGITVKTERWFFQVKKYGKGVGVPDITSDISQAPSQGADCYAIMSNTGLTSDAREYIEKESTRLRMKIKDYTGENFLRILFRNPRIAEAYVDLKVPGRFNEENQKVQMGDIIVDRGLTKDIKIDIFDEKSLVQTEETFDKLGLDQNIRAFFYYAIGNMLAGARKYLQALEYLDKSLRIAPNNTNTLLDKGHVLVNLNKTENARSIYEKVLKKEPENQFALLGIGVTLERKGFDKEALEHFERINSLYPDFIIARNNKAKTLAKIGRYKEALETANETLRIRPNETGAYQVKSEILGELRAYDRAYEIAKKALDIRETPELLNHIGHILTRANQIPEAKVYFEKSSKMDPNFSLALSNRAVCLDAIYLETKDKNELVQAESLLETASSLTPYDTNVHRTKAYVNLHQGRLKEAMDEVNLAEKFANDKTTKVLALCAKARIYYAKKSMVNALMKIKEATEQDQYSEFPWITELQFAQETNDSKKIKTCQERLERIKLHYYEIQKKLAPLF